MGNLRAMIEQDARFRRDKAEALAGACRAHEAPALHC